MINEVGVAVLTETDREIARLDGLVAYWRSTEGVGYRIM